MSKGDQEYSSQNPAFKNRREALISITQAGFIVSRSKFYNDCSKPGKENGTVLVREDGSVDESEIRKYCKTLKRIEGDIDDLKSIQESKGLKEVEKLEEQVKKLRFERLREEGKYIPRRDFEAELAARAVIFETGFKHRIQENISELIALVGGQPEKAPDFLERLHNEIESELSEYATTETFQVMFLEK